MSPGVWVDGIWGVGIGLAGQCMGGVGRGYGAMHGVVSLEVVGWG